MGIYLKELKIAVLWVLCFLYILMVYLITAAWLWPFMDDYWNIIEFGIVVSVAFILEVMTLVYLKVERKRLRKMMADEGWIIYKPAAPPKKKTAMEMLREELKDELKEDIEEEIKKKGGEK